MKKRIIAVHLLNDRSGSPLVLRQALEVLQEHHEVILYTATPSGDGFLNDIENVEQRSIFYRWSKNKFATLLYYIVSQVLLFFRLAAVLRQGDTVYVNTLLPFGAALAGCVRGARVIYHVQEVSLKPAALKGFLFRVADATAHKVLFVSGYVAGHYSFRRAEVQVIHNCLPESFIRRTNDISRVNLGLPFTVLMLCSLKEYKGVYHFINIARSSPELRFMLVLNASEKEVATFHKVVDVPENCLIYASQRDTAPFYKEAHVVCNLSKPSGWVETFGMTLLEAMHCGRPVICPPVGGVLEVVEHGVQGYAVDSSEEYRIGSLLRGLANDLGRYIAMAQAACDKAGQFSSDHFEQKLIAAFSMEEPMQKMHCMAAVFPETGMVK